MKEIGQRLQALTGAGESELRPMVWAFLYFLFLLCGYYILRPVRDVMAIEGGVQHLPSMMTATFLTLVVVTPAFGYLSARVPRYVLLLSIYGFFGSHLLGFFLLMVNGIEPQWVARIFFVWLSVFNLFVVSIFWSFMADLFTPDQGARLFGIIAAGGSSGAIIGPLLTTGLTYVVPVPALMLVSAGFLLACGGCIYRLERIAKRNPSNSNARTGVPIGGSMWAGIRLTVSSPYLMGICAYVFLLTTSATFIYLEQVKLVGEQIPALEERARLFATIDLAVNIATFVTQVFITNQMIARFGLVSALVLVPCVSAVGFWIVGLLPLLAVFIVFTVVRRIGEYAISKPAREILFTVLNREEKYKAKNFIDTAVSRGGDAASGWIVNGAKSLGLTVTQIAWIVVPLAFLWAWIGRMLAREAEERSMGTSPEGRVHPVYCRKNRML